MLPKDQDRNPNIILNIYKLARVTEITTHPTFRSDIEKYPFVIKNFSHIDIL